jgi:hypothetical protein
MKSPMRYRTARKAALAVIAAGVLSATMGVGTAQAATTSNLLYSTDGGASWSSSASVEPGDNVLVRQWYNNDGAANETNARITTTLPTGFSLVGGSTKVCLNPSTTVVASPDNSELLCEDSNEVAVWNGSDLQVSPSAGHYGESNGSTSGDLAFGRKRYLNLQSCAYRNPSTWFNAVIPAPSGGAQFDGLTNVSNTAATTLQCGAAGTADSLTYTLATDSSGFEVLPLLGRKYLNLSQCSYLYDGQDWYSGWTTTAAGGSAYDAGTNTSNTPGTGPDCGGTTAGYSYQPNSSGFQALELNARYLNLSQCTYWDSVDTSWYTSINPTPYGGALFDAGTNVSATPDTEPTCGAPSGGYSYGSTTSAVAALDLLDNARARGYVQYEITAPTTPEASVCANGVPASEQFTQNGALTSVPSGVKAASGDLAVEWSALSDPCNTGGVPMADARIAGAGLVFAAGAAFVALRKRTVAAI